MLEILEHLRPLFFLNRLRFRAAVLGRFKQLKTLKGVFFVAVIVAIVVLLRRSFVRYASEENYIIELSTAAASQWYTLGLLAACFSTVLTSSGSPLHFSLAEMNILSSAPIRRSSLVVYKVLSYFLGAILSALLLSLLLPKTELNRAVIFSSVVLSLIFIQLLSAVLVMGAMVARKRWPYLPSKKHLLLFYLPIAMVCIVIASSFRVPPESLQLGMVDRLSVLANDATDWALVAALASPFELFSSLYVVPDSVSEYLTRVFLGLTVLCGLIIAIVVLDRFLIDETSASSLVAHNRWQSILKGGSVWQSGTGKLRSRSAPMVFGSAASIAWSQWLRLFRSVPTIAYGLPSLSLLMGVILGMNGSAIVASRLFPPLLFFLLVFMLPKILTYDFRGTLGIVEKLKALPTSSTSICAGQLFTPVVFASILQWLVIVGALPFASNQAILILLALASMVIPINFLIYAIDNISFLFFPSRLVPVGRMDFDFLGRSLLDFLLKCIVLAVALAGVLIVAQTVWTLTSHSFALTVLAMLLVLFVEMLLALTMLTYAYRQYDITRKP